MKRKMLLTVFVLLILATFSGCSLCTKIEYRDRWNDRNVEVPCVVNDVKCDTSGNDTQVVVHLVECIVDLKKEAAACQPE